MMNTQFMFCDMRATPNALASNAQRDSLGAAEARH
jgi:hypothetical protein